MTTFPLLQLEQRGTAGPKSCSARPAASVPRARLDQTGLESANAPHHACHPIRVRRRGAASECSSPARHQYSVAARSPGRDTVAHSGTVGASAMRADRRTRGSGDVRRKARIRLSHAHSVDPCQVGSGNRMGLQAGGHRFDPGTLHHKKVPFLQRFRRCAGIRIGNRPTRGASGVLSRWRKQLRSEGARCHKHMVGSGGVSDVSSRSLSRRRSRGRARRSRLSKCLQIGACG
jgi:hypothetical protein